MLFCNGCRLVTLDANPFESNEVQYDAEFESFDDVIASQGQDVVSASNGKSSKNTLFQCDKCTYKSQSQDLFDRHRARHSTDRPFVCTSCKYSVLDHSKFVDHLAIHQQSKVIQCPFCPQASYASTMKLHMLKHRAMEAFDCSACDFISNNFKSLKHHTKVHHNQLFKCEYCHERMTKHLLVKHWYEEHGIREVSADNADERGNQWEAPPMSPEIPVKSEDAQNQRNGIAGAPHAESNDKSETADFADDETESFSCQICEFSSHLRVLLKYHVLSMHTKKVACSHCSAMMTKHALIEHSKNSHGLCVYFDGRGLQEAAPKSDTLVRNPKERKVLGRILQVGDTFKCSICKFSSLLKINVQKHIDKMHSRKYACNNCPVVMTKYDLIKHARLKHGVIIKPKSGNIVEVKRGRDDSGSVSDGEESYKSEVVSDQFFPTQTTIDINRYIVSKGNTFSCSVCKYCNNWRPQVEMHVEKLHVRKYHCKYCPQAMNKYDLIKHSMAVHKVVMSIKTPGLKEFRQDDVSPSVDQDWQVMDDRGSIDPGFDNHSETNTIGPAQNDHTFVIGKPFACSFCDFTSHNERSLTRHVNLLHTTKYHCNDCPKIMTKHDIIKHSWDEHGIEIRPGLCGLREAKQDLENPEVIQNDTVAEETVFAGYQFAGHFLNDTQNQSMTDEQSSNPKSCDICGFIAKYPSGMSAHIDLIHTRRFCCPHCPAVMSKYELIDHGWNAHGIMIKLKNRHLKEFAEDSDSFDAEDRMSGFDNDDPELEYQGKSTSRIRCAFCDYCASTDRVDTHVDRMHMRKFQCEYCAVVMPKYDLIKHYKNEHGRDLSSRGYHTYKFKKADDLFNGQSDQLSHLDVGLNQYDPASQPSSSQDPSTSNASKRSSFSCSFCGYSSLYVRDVRKHEESQHQLKFYCTNCPSIMTKYELVQHYKNAHDMHVSRYGKPKFIAAKETEANVVAEEIHADEHNMLDKEAEETETNKGAREVNTDEHGMIGDNSTCSVCGFVCKNRNSLVVHTERMHRKRFHCSHCSVVMTKYELIKHCKNSHDVHVSRVGRNMFFEADETETNGGPREVHAEENESGGLQKAEYTADPIAGTFDCNTCDFSTLYKKVILRHVTGVHRQQYSCEHCSALMTKYELVEHSKDVHGIDIPWDSRGYKLKQVAHGSLNNEDSLNGRNQCQLTPKPDHENDNGYSMFTGAGGKSQFKCNKCEFTSRHLHSISSHFLKYHTTLYCCDTCPTVTTKYDLVEHYKNDHNVTFSDFKQHRGPRFLAYKTKSEQMEQCCSKELDQKSSKSAYYSLTEPKASEEQNTIHQPFMATTENGEFSCTICGIFTKTHQKLSLHMERLHLKKFSCDICPVVMTKYDLIQHYKDVHGIAIRNNGKGKTFKAVTDEEADHADDESEFIRSVASRPRSTSKPEMVYERIEQSDSLYIQQNGGDFMCTLCDWSTKNKGSIPGHVETMHKKMVSCRRCSVVLTKYEMLQHYESNHDLVINPRANTTKYFKFVDQAFEGTLTDDCANNAVHEAEIRDDNDDQSMTIIKEGKEFKCSICGFSTLHKFNLKPHFESFHQKKYSCNSCSFVATKYDMVFHYENTHRFVIPNFGKGRIGPYMTAVVELSETMVASAFADGMVETVIDDISTTGAAAGLAETVMDDVNEDDLEPITGGGGEYKCPICEFSSTWRGNLKAHVHALHNRKYSCDRCSFISTKYDMIQHYVKDHNVKKGVKSPLFKSLYCDPEAQGSSDVASESRDWVAESEPANVQTGDESGCVFRDAGEYRCPFCDFSSQTRRSAEYHLVALHRKNYSCNRCSVVMNKYEMMQHFEIDHGVEIPNKGRGFTVQYFTAVDQDSNVADHSELQHPSKTIETNEPNAQEQSDFKCTVCDFYTKYKGNLKSHEENYHNKKFSCKHCSIVLTKHEMARHCEDDHGIAIPRQGPNKHFFVEASDDPIPAEEEPTISADNSGDLACVMCDFTTKYSHRMESHVTSLHKRKFACPQCPAVLTKHNIVKHCHKMHGLTLSFHSKLEEVVNDCEDVGPSSESSVKGVIRFKCSLCDYSSKLRMHLQVHTKNMHTTKRACNLCSATMSKHELLGHYRKAHPNAHNGVIEQSNPAHGDDPQPGPSAASDVNVTGQNEFNCSVCDFSTHLKYSLASHIEALHTKKYHCNHCSAIMTKHEIISHCENVHGVVVHIKGQSWKEASADSEEYDDVSDAEAMQARNTHSCGTCSFATKVKWYLKDHVEKLHKKKYHCQQCSAVMTKHELIKHVKNVHGLAFSWRQALSEAKDSSNSAAEGSSKLWDFAGPSAVVQNVDHARCHKCDFSTPHTWYLKDHIESFHKKKYSCGRCSAVMTKFELRKHMSDRHGVILNMKGKMPKSVVSKDHENHAESKLEFKKPKRYPCVACPFSSFHEFGLKRHIKLQHTIKYPCHLCSTVLTRHALIKHCQTVHNTKIPENQPDEGKSSNDVNGDHSSSTQDSSQILNPKFQDQIDMDVMQSPTFQPVVTLERLPIEVDDLDSTFSVLDNTNTADSEMVANPKFSHSTAQLNSL